MLSFLEKIRYSIIAFAFGALMVFLALFKVDDITKLKVDQLPAPNPIPLRIGLAFLAISLVSGALSQFGDAIWLPKFSRRVTREKDGWAARVGEATMHFTFGRVEEIATSGPGNLVVLPANEFFDDECITDVNSALGSFVAENFKNQSQYFLEALRVALRDKATQQVERAAGVMRASYLVGATAYLPRALGTGWNILMVAVTTQRAREGLRAEIGTIFTLADAIGGTMADHRLTNVVLPLIGSGHGGLRTTAALAALVVAFIEVLRRPAAHGIRNVTIVVFRKSKGEKPAINDRLVRRTVARAFELYGI